MSGEQFQLPLNPQSEPNSFERIKLVNAHGADYWSARDLQDLLGYNHWRNFEKAIGKGITSCEKSGNSAEHHFARAQNDRAWQGRQARSPRFPALPLCLLPDRPERRSAQAGDRFPKPTSFA